MTHARLDEMRQHIQDLLDEHGIIHDGVRRGGWAVFGADEVRFQPIKSAVTYATALHEIGHILGRHQLSKKVMVRKKAAWGWAEGNAIVWTPPMARKRDECLAWYGARARGIDARLTAPSWLPQL
jgi:hypothetical protein